MQTATYFIEKLRLIKHPEGGWYKEVYRSADLLHARMLSKDFTGTRNICTSIYFLLQGHEKSVFHRIRSDETWHFYAGTVMRIYELSEQGTLKMTLLGNHPDRNQQFQYTVPKNTWFAACVEEDTSFALVGCTVSPGFDFNDFEMGRRDELMQCFPQHRAVIQACT